jgi:hypothetical protein
MASTAKRLQLLRRAALKGMKLGVPQHDRIPPGDADISVKLLFHSLVASELKTEQRILKGYLDDV